MEQRFAFQYLRGVLVREIENKANVYQLEDILRTSQLYFYYYSALMFHKRI